MTEKISLTIDGTAVAVEPGVTILEASRELGKSLPTLCYHDNISPANACRACVVEVEGSRTLVPSCSRKCEEGMIVKTNSPRVANARKVVGELLSSDVNDALAPDLLSLMEQTGGNRERFAWGETRMQTPVKEDNRLFARDYSQCILCYRCVDVCGTEAQNTFAITVAGRGFTAHVDAGFDRALPESDCVFCGNCVAVCPTGALMDLGEWKLRQEGRWDPEQIETTNTTCSYCGVGCELTLHTMDNRIVKVTSPDDNPVTHGMLCVKGRYGYPFVQAEE